MTELNLCPICAEPFKAGDMCATDIELGICHAGCLEGSPTVNLDTGEPVDGPIPTYRYDEDAALSQPQAGEPVAWEAIDEEGSDNFATSIYEEGYKGLLVARCNQNGNYPWQAAAILRGLEANRSALAPQPALAVKVRRVERPPLQFDETTVASRPPSGEVEALRKAVEAFRIYARSLRGPFATRSDIADSLDIQADVAEAALSTAPATADGWRTKGAVADQIIGQIEERFPNWRSYRDLIDCIDCTLADLRGPAAPTATGGR